MSAYCCRYQWEKELHYHNQQEVWKCYSCCLLGDSYLLQKVVGYNQQDSLAAAAASNPCQFLLAYKKTLLPVWFVMCQAWVVLKTLAMVFFKYLHWVLTIWVVHLIRTTLCDINKCDNFFNDVILQTGDHSQKFELAVWFLLTIALIVSEKLRKTHDLLKNDI